VTFQSISFFIVTAKQFGASG